MKKYQKRKDTRQRRMRVTQLSKAAFLFFINYDRERLEVLPLTSEEEEKMWKRVKKHAPAATETTVCLALTPSEVAVLKREGYKTKTRYITI